MDEKLQLFNKLIYNDANQHAEKILESMLPQMREALVKAYALGFMKAMMLNKKKQEKSNGNNK